MLIRIDPEKPVPLHVQIAGQIREGIANGSALEGERLPTVRALATELEVNMHTVLRAYKDLEAEELVSIRQGRGVLIQKAGQARARRLQQLITDTIKDASKLGLSIQQLLILLESAT